MACRPLRRLTEQTALLTTVAVAAVVMGLAFSGVVSVGAQEPQPAAPVFRAGVDAVRVDVSVFADGDKVVNDLQASDFEIFEDGIAQEIATAAFVRSDGTRSSNTNESLKIRSREHAAAEAERDDVRVFAIFLDDYHVDKALETMQRVRKALTAFVGGFGPNDIVAVMDPLTPLSALTFTRSRDELLRRMEEFEGRRFEVYPVRSVMEEAQLRSRNVWELRGSVSLSALEALVTYLGGLREGRTSVLFVSQGPTMGAGGLGNMDRLRMVVQAANRGNVTIHAFDPRPLGSSRFMGENSLAQLTYETGGRLISNSNRPDSRLAQMIADASAYYLLAYTPNRPVSDGKYHKIEVKVKRRGMRVRSRRGYWAPTLEERSAAPPPPRDPGMSEALATLVKPYAGQVVDMWIGASAGAGDVTTLTMTWEPSERGSDVDRVDIEPVHPGQSPPPAGPPLAEDARSIASESSATFDVTPGEESAFRLTARAMDGEVLDQWDYTTVAPAFAGTPLAMTTPRFFRARSAFEWRVLTTSADPLPVASRTFSRTDRVLVDVGWHTDGDESPVVTASLLNTKGDSLAALPVAPQSSGHGRVTLPLSSLAGAAYVIRVEARLGGEVVEQNVAFTVE
jgi:VWFA-related protein